MGTESSGGNNIPILNACLAYVRYNMISRDKLYLMDATTARFDLNAIKTAHEVLSRYCDPSLHYSYKGPKKASPRDKAIHAVDEIFKIMVNLDAQGMTPIIACPSEDLYKVLAMNGHCDHKMIEDRFQKLEGEVSYVKGMERSLEDLKSTVLALMTSTNLPPPTATAIPPVVQERLQSEIISQNMQQNQQPSSKPRSASVCSSKRPRSDDDSDSEFDVEYPFRIPKYHKKKLEKRQKRSPDNKTYSNVTQSTSAPKQTPIRRQANWGKITDTSSTGFAGAVPDLFIFNCRDKPEESTVKSYLESKNLKIVKVEMKSSPHAYTRSFKVTVASHDDYDKLHAGDLLPVGVAVKKFIYPKRRFGAQSWSNQAQSMDTTSVTNSTNDLVDPRTRASINDFYKLTDSELSSLIKSREATKGNTSADDVSKNTNIITGNIVSSSPPK